MSFKTAFIVTAITNPVFLALGLTAWILGAPGWLWVSPAALGLVGGTVLTLSVLADLANRANTPSPTGPGPGR